MNSPSSASERPPSEEGSGPKKSAPERRKVRLIVVSDEQLPEGVVEQLEKSPLPCQRVASALEVRQLGRRDVVILPHVSQLPEVIASIQPDKLKDKRNQQPLVVVLGNPNDLPFGAEAKLDLTWVMPTGNAEEIARQILKCITAALVRRGILKPKKPTHPKLKAGSLIAKRRSRRPSRFPVSTSALGLAKGGASPTLPKPAALPRSSLDAMAAVRPEQDRRVEPTRNVQATSSPKAPPKPIRSVMPETVHIEGSRWLLLDDNVARAHAVANAINSSGATVELAGLIPAPGRLAAMRNFDAAGVLVEEASLPVVGELLKLFEVDPRLSWVRLVAVRWEGLYDEQKSKVDKDGLKLLLLPHWQAEHDLLAKLSGGEDVEIERIGPAKLMRAAARFGGLLQLELRQGRKNWLVKIADGELLSIAVGGKPVARDKVSETLTSLVAMSGGVARMTPGTPDKREKSLGPLIGILKAISQPLPGEVAFAHQPPRSQHAPPRSVHPMLAQSVSPGPYYGPLPLPGNTPLGVQNAPVNTQWWHLPREQRSWFAMGAGVMTTALAMSFFTSKEEPSRAAVAVAPTAPPVVTSVAMPTVQPVKASVPAPVQPVKSAAVPALKAPASPPPTATAKTVPVPAPQAPGEQPQGCSRWNNAQKPAMPQPHQAKSAWRLARKAIQMGNLAKAEEMLCISVAMDAQGPGAVGLVRLQFSQNNLKSAVRWAEWAYAQRPDDPEVKQVLADVRNRQGKIDEARALLHDAMGLSAADVHVLKQVARKYADSGQKALNALDPGQAERLFRRAMTLDGKNALASAGMAQLALRKGNIQEAFEYASAAVGLDPTCFEGQLALGDAYAESKQEAEAKAAWLEAGRLRPRSKEVRARLGL